MNHEEVAIVTATPVAVGDCSGIIAPGRPIGTTWAGVPLTLLHGVQPDNARKGLATACTDD